MSARVLVVEDDETMAGVLLAYLTRAGYESLWASNGIEALDMWSQRKPDVVILDILLPTISGLEVLRRRRASADDAAVIILSARGEEEDRLVGLETGADDYVVKPFSPREVVLRVDALLRRAERLTGNRLLNECLSIGDVTIDLAAHVATRGGSQLSLTSREFDLLAFLAANPGQMAFTVTPLPLTSAARARVRPTSACFEAVYAVTYGAPTSPASEAMLITRPQRRSSIPGSTARASR